MSTCQTHENVNLMEFMSVFQPVLSIFGDMCNDDEKSRGLSARPLNERRAMI